MAGGRAGRAGSGSRWRPADGTGARRRRWARSGSCRRVSTGAEALAVDSRDSRAPLWSSTGRHNTQIDWLVLGGARALLPLLCRSLRGARQRTDLCGARARRLGSGLGPGRYASDRGVWGTDGTAETRAMRWAAARGIAGSAGACSGPRAAGGGVGGGELEALTGPSFYNEPAKREPTVEKPQNLGCISERLRGIPTSGEPRAYICQDVGVAQCVIEFNVS